VLGRQVGAGSPRADAVGHAFLLAPADELQRVGRVDVVLRRRRAPLVDAGGPEATELRKARSRAPSRALDGELALAAKGRRAGRPELRRLEAQERDDLAAEKARLDAAAWAPPAQGSYFTNRLVPLSRSLPARSRHRGRPCAARRADRQGEPARRRAAPAARAGRASFVGMAKCGAVTSRRRRSGRRPCTRRRGDTLVAGGKQADYKCVRCHVTGYGEVGGSSLGHTTGLENVPVRDCHGAGSIHVAEKGLEDPPAVHRNTSTSDVRGLATTRHTGLGNAHVRGRVRRACADNKSSAPGQRRADGAQRGVGGGPTRARG
jgi:hypothetical protein